MVSGTSFRSTQQRISSRPIGEIAPAPPPKAFEALLDEYAPFGPVPLIPEVSAFQGRVLLELWDAAERLAGQTLPPPYWGYPWPAGIALGRCLLDQPELVRGKRVLDLGTGGGVVAFAALRAGAAEVIANDWDPWALLTARLAAERQGLSITTLEGELTRGEGGAEVDEYDVVLCSDLSYDRAVAPFIHAFLSAASARGALVLAADAERAYFDSTGYRLLLSTRVPTPRDLEGAEERWARVYLLEPPSP